MKLNKNMQDGWELKKLSLLLCPYHSSILYILLIVSHTAFWHGFIILFIKICQQSNYSKMFWSLTAWIIRPIIVVTVSLFRKGLLTTAERDRPPTRSVQYDSKAASRNLPSCLIASPFFPAWLFAERIAASGTTSVQTDDQNPLRPTNLQSCITPCRSTAVRTVRPPCRR